MNGPVRKLCVAGPRITSFPYVTIKSERLVRGRSINVNGLLGIVCGWNFLRFFQFCFCFHLISHHPISFVYFQEIFRDSSPYWDMVLMDFIYTDHSSFILFISPHFIQKVLYFGRLLVNMCDLSCSNKCCKICSDKYVFV